MSQIAKVIYWNHLVTYIQCPFCNKKHKHAFAGYEAVVLTSHPECGSSLGQYLIRYPSSWWIDKDNGWYVRASYRDSLPENEGVSIAKRSNSDNSQSKTSTTRQMSPVLQTRNGLPDQYSLVRHESYIDVCGPFKSLEIDRPDREVAMLLRPKSYELLYAKTGSRGSKSSDYIAEKEWTARARLISQAIGHTLPSPMKGDTKAEASAGHVEKQLIAKFLSMHTWDDIASSNTHLSEIQIANTRATKRYEDAVACQITDAKPYKAEFESARSELQETQQKLKDIESAIQELRKPYPNNAFLDKMREIEPPGRLRTASIFISSLKKAPCRDCQSFIESVNKHFAVRITVEERTTIREKAAEVQRNITRAPSPPVPRLRGLSPVELPTRRSTPSPSVPRTPTVSIA